MYSEILSDIINRLEVIEDLTVLFRQRNIDSDLPVAMLAPKTFNITDSKAVTDLVGSFEFSITVYADSFPELLALIERIETSIQLDESIPNTIKLSYKGFRVAETESVSDRIEPCEMLFSAELCRSV
ncbi:MAG: hypothetical protein V9H25_06625 [Candidatus Competibacter sp.]|jgi:hypothetical protein